MLNVLLGISFLVSICRVIVEDGSPPELWQNAAVLYAEVQSTKLNNEEIPNKSDKHPGGALQNADYSIRIKPIATLTGNFDSAREQDIEIQTQVFGTAVMDQGAIHQVPANHAKIIVMIKWNDSASDRKNRVPTWDVRFFPQDTNKNRPALFEVTGFDDPKVTETIENLRKLRADQNSTSILRPFFEKSPERAENAAAEKKRSPARTLPPHPRPPANSSPVGDRS